MNTQKQVLSWAPYTVDKLSLEAIRDFNNLWRTVVLNDNSLRPFYSWVRENITQVRMFLNIMKKYRNEIENLSGRNIENTITYNEKLLQDLKDENWDDIEWPNLINFQGFVEMDLDEIGVLDILQQR